MTVPRADGLSLADLVVLTLLTEEPRHGWSVVRELAPDGPVGRVWTLSRPLTYRALDGLVARGLARPMATEPGRGARRTIVAATAAGRRRARAWLVTPVVHLRDVRTELLLKLVLAPRLGVDVRSLLREQERVFRPIIAALERALTAPDADVVDRWRFESAQAVARFLAAVRAGA